MNILARLRAARSRSTGSTAALLAFAWVALISPSCVMALSVEGVTAGGDHAAHHDCPHCPPESTIEVSREDCSSLDSLTVPRPDKTAEPPALAATDHAPLPTAPPALAAAPPQTVPAPPPRPGPRLHLRHGQFNE